MNAWLRKTAMIWLVGGATLLANLGGPRLWDRDEPRNAGCAEEMLARHDWIVPTFNGELRTHKPVLLYWAMMAADQLPVDREFAARLPSALCGIGTLIVTFLIGNRIYGESTGRLAALILASSIMFVVAGRAATPDATLTFLTTLALYVFVCAAFAPLPPGKAEAHATLERGWQVSQWNAIGLYAAMAVAVLAKGPVGFVLPWTVVLAFTLLDHHSEFVDAPIKWHRRCIKLLHWLVGMLQPEYFVRNLRQLRPVTLVVAMAAIALPWYVWVGIRTDGEWLRGFFVEHNLERALRPLEGHSGGLWFYPVAILAGFFPWSVFMVPLGIFSSHARALPLRERRATSFFWIWIFVYVAAFSLARTKLPSYVTPTYPALALLTSRFLHVAAVPSRSLLPWMRASYGVLIITGITCMIGLPLMARLYLPGEEWLGIVGIVPLFTGVIAWWYWSCNERFLLRRTLVSGATLFCLFLFVVLAPRIDQHQHSDQLLNQSGLQIPGARLAAYGILEPSWVYYAKRPIDEISRGDETSLMNLMTATDHLYVLARSDDAETLEQRYPDHFSRVAEAPYFLRHGQIVLLANRPPTVASQPLPPTANAAAPNFR